MSKLEESLLRKKRFNRITCPDCRKAKLTCVFTLRPLVFYSAHCKKCLHSIHLAYVTYQYAFNYIGIWNE